MKINIRPLVQKDAHTSVKWRNIPELWVHTKFHATREIKLEDELNWIKKVRLDPSSSRFAIEADGVYVGNIYLTDIHTGQDAEYHIFIGDKDYWGKGIARKASVLIIDYAKAKLKLKTIRLEVKKDNAAAYHLYESLGFEKTDKNEDGFEEMQLDLAGWNGDPRENK